VHLLEEQCCQISSQFDLKRQSLRGLGTFEEVTPTRTIQQEEQDAAVFGFVTGLIAT